MTSSSKVVISSSFETRARAKSFNSTCEPSAPRTYREHQRRCLLILILHTTLESVVPTRRARPVPHHARIHQAGATLNPHHARRTPSGRAMGEEIAKHPCSCMVHPPPRSPCRLHWLDRHPCRCLLIAQAISLPFGHPSIYLPVPSIGFGGFGRWFCQLLTTPGRGSCSRRNTMDVGPGIPHRPETSGGPTGSLPSNFALACSCGSYPNNSLGNKEA